MYAYSGNGYDSAGRLTSIGHAAGATVIDSFTYSLDGNGNRTAATSNAGTESYTLDGLNRITAATYPGALSEEFVYDAAGNRTDSRQGQGQTFPVIPRCRLNQAATSVVSRNPKLGNISPLRTGAEAMVSRRTIFHPMLPGDLPLKLNLGAHSQIKRTERFVTLETA